MRLQDTICSGVCRSAEGRAEVRAAKKKAAQESHARKLARARDALKATEAKFRQPRERNPKFLSWLRRAPCLTCEIGHLVQIGRTDPAHVRRAYPEPGWRPVGGSEKPSDHRALPLCRACHVDQHDHDNHDWYADRGIYPPEVCAELMRAHLAGADPVEAVETIAAEIRAAGIHPSRARKHEEDEAR